MTGKHLQMQSLSQAAISYNVQTKWGDNSHLLNIKLENEEHTKIGILIRNSWRRFEKI